jgi:tRNA threonylcarbamoyladenosine biosynthesis protein TsaB
MITLALDTSTSQGGVALLRGHQVLSREIWRREKSHSEFLTPTIEACLRTTGLLFSQIDLLAVGRGPGSFTGIRIAVNAARSLSYALKKPIRAFTTHEILAMGTLASELPLVALVNAHKNLIYTQIFRHRAGRWQPDEEIAPLSLDQLAQLIQTPHLCVGDAFEEYRRFFAPELLQNLLRTEPALDYPLPEVLGLMAAELGLESPTELGAAPTMDWNELQALYIRASGAEESLGARQ